MRGRHVFLALLIIVGGLGINSYQRGWFAEAGRNWRQRLTALPEISPVIRQSNPFAGEWMEVKRSEQTLAFRGADRIVIDNPYGHVFVAGKSQKKINLETVKWGRALTLEEAMRKSDLAQLQIQEAGRDLKLTVTGPPDYSSKAQIDLYLTLPRDFALRGESIIGNFHIENLQGEIEVSTINSKIEIIGGKKIAAGSVNGVIEVSRAEGPLFLENKNNTIYLTDTGGKARAANIIGGIMAIDVRGEIDFSSVSGEIYLERFGGARGRLETTSGKIAAGVAGNYAGSLEAESISGPIQLTLPSDIDCRVKLNTLSGGITNPLPLTGRFVKSHRFEGKAGDGRGELKAATVSGAITLESDSNYPIPWAP